MYCYVVKLQVFSLQRGSAKPPIAPSNFSSLWLKLAWDKSHDPTANSQNLEDMWITPDYNYYNQHGGAGLQLTGQHYSPNSQQYTVGHCFCKVWSFWHYECWKICTFIYLQPDGSDYHSLAFGTNYGGGGLQLTGQHYSHHRQHTVGHLFFLQFWLKLNLKKYTPRPRGVLTLQILSFL